MSSPLTTLADLISAAPGNNPSKYSVRYFSMGEPKTVTVDSLCPVIGVHCEPAFAASRGNTCAAFSLVEKAFAKIASGSYHNLAGGNCAEALYDLLGVGVEDLHLDDKSVPATASAEKIKDLVSGHLSLKHLLATGHIDTKKKGDDAKRIVRNLRMNHAYAIIKANDTHVFLYNPHGHDDDFEGEGGDGQGTLKITWKQFHSAFNRLQVCPVSVLTTHSSKQLFQKSQAGVTAGGCTNFPSFRNNDMLIVTVEPSSGELVLTMGQNDKRGIPREDGEKLSYDEIGITVIELISGSSDPFDFLLATPEKYKVFAKTRSFANKRDTTLSVPKVDKQTTLGIVCSTFNPGVELDYFCEVRSRRELPAMKWTSEVAAKRTQWSGSLPASLRLDSLSGCKKVGIFLKQRLKKTEKKENNEPVGCWMLDAVDNRVLAKPAFVKAGETSMQFDLEANQNSGSIVLCPVLFKGGTKAAAAAVFDVEIVVAGSLAGDELLVEKLAQTIDPASGEAAEKKKSTTAVTTTTVTKKKKGGGGGGRRGGGGRGSGGGGGGNMHVVSMGKAGEELKGLSDLYANL
jgi:hypothetical protein